MNTAKTTAYQQMKEAFDFVRANEPMHRHTSFKIGGPADLFALPATIDQLQAVIKKAGELGIPVSVFGSGTNLLISDNGIRGLVVATGRLKSGIRITRSDSHHTLVSADAGERLAGLCRFANENGLSGLEFAAGIPGTVGGALAMNAGTPHGQMADIVLSLELLDPSSGKVHSAARPALDFVYRRLNTNSIILSGCFEFVNALPEQVQAAYRQHLEKKQLSQPVQAASAGCFFKNPDHAPPAGKLIEEAGLKGKKVNGAMVSPLHANYIVNLGNATCKDVIQLQKIIQNEILTKYGIHLDTEVRVEGEI